MHPPRRSSPIDFGLLALVVGPSGAGKDTLIAGARVRLTDDRRFAFPARVVTRPRDGGAEQHIPLSVVDFGAAEKSGELALSWHAHGHSYGIPSRALDGLALGQIVVVNISRTIIGIAEALATRVAVLNVTASPAVLAMRLSARGRESLEDAQRRLDRDVPIVTRGAPVITIINEGLPAAGIDHFTSVLLDLAGGLAAENGQ
jgi:phosphonate metabolism protein PhnN/1,5-bisphosphokinase (PRPP-forming)